MADKKISALSSASLPLAGTEVLPIVQSSSTVKVATDDLTVKNVRSNATTGILQIAGPGTGTTRVMTTPNANFTAARTDAAQTFSGVQTFSNQVNITGTVASGAANAGVFANSSGQFQTWVLGANTSTYGTYLLVQARSDLSSSRQLLSFDTSGNGSFDSGNVAFATAAKGINFTANTPAAGMTSQLLNAYEEGTFTATMTPATSGTITLKTNGDLMTYTRVGRLVTITGMLWVDSVSSPVGTYVEVNLPITPANIGEYSCRGSGACRRNVSGTITMLPVGWSEAYAKFSIVIDASTIAGGDEYNITVTYVV